MIRSSILLISLIFIMWGISCDWGDHKDNTCGDGEISAADAVWSHGEGDLQNSKRAPGIRQKGCFTGPQTTPQIQWSFTLGGPGTAAAPVIGDDGTIYIVGEYPGEVPGGGIRNTGLMAISSEGSLKWFFPVPYDAGNSLYKIYFESAAIGKDQTIYFGGWDSTLYALNSNGTIKWKKSGFHHRFGGNKNGYPPVTIPAIDNQGRIYSGTDTIFCFQNDGKVIWKFNDDTLGYCIRIAIGRNHIFCAIQNRGILALGYDGKRKWFYPVDLFNIPHYGMIVDEDDNLYFKVNSNILLSISSKGQFLWSTGGGAITEPVLRGDFLYFGTFGVVLRVNKNDGSEDSVLSALPVDYHPDASPLIDDNGIVFIGSRPGRTVNPPSDNALLSAVTSEGHLLWQFDLAGSYHGSYKGKMALGPDGTLFLATFADGNPDGVYKLFAIK